MRRSLLILFALAACATPAGPTEHGPVFGDAGVSDASRDVVSRDAPMDVEASDGGQEGGGDAGDGGGCASRVAVVGGSLSGTFAAVWLAAAWTTSAPPGSLAAAPALVPFGTGFHAVMHETDDSLKWMAFDAAWSTPASLAGASARDAPAMAPVGAALHVAYQAVDYKYFHDQFSGAWGAVPDAVGAPQSFGARAPSAASVGGKLVLAQVGTNAHIYAQTWDASWQTAMDVSGPFDAAPGLALQDVHPVIVAMSGAADAMIVFLSAGDFKLMSVTRTGSTWSTPLLVDVNAFTSEPFSALALPGGRALIAWRGSDGKAYFSLFGGTSWGAPSPFLTPNATVLSAPALAPGVCGVEALAALPGSASVTVLGLTGSTWSASYSAIPSSPGATFVAIATRP